MVDNYFILRFLTEDSDIHLIAESFACLLYTSDAADEAKRV